MRCVLVAATMSTPGAGLQKEGKKGKKGKAAKVPPRQLYYGPEEMDTRGAVPILRITRRARTGNDTTEQGFSGWSQAPKHRSAPVFTAPSHRAAPILDAISLVDLTDIQVNIPPVQSATNREEGFREHWAFRPAPTYIPYKEAAKDMRPYIERMLASIMDRQQREREAAEEAARLAKLAAKGKKKAKTA